MLPRFLSPGPLFTLEMLTSARRARYFVVRVLYAAVLFFALYTVYDDYSFRADYYSDIAVLARKAWDFFITFSYLQILAVVVTGPAIAAGTIATERERRTIEYLFASPLSNAEIVFGKLLARLMQLGYLVLVGMPILFIAMLMGGIAPQAIVVLLIVTLSTAVTVSIISITVSVWSARAREAVTRAYLALFVLLVLPYMIFIMLIITRNTWFSNTIEPLNGQMLAANPFWVLSNILIKASSANTAAAWDTLLAMLRDHIVICLLGITASIRAVRRVHLAAMGKTPKERRRRRRRLVRPSLGDRPMLWKEIIAEPAATKLGFIGRIAMMLIVVAVLTPTICIFYNSISPFRYNSRFSEYFDYSMSMGALIGCGVLLLIAARAAGSITSEKERDCWVSLISSPMEPREIIIDKIIGNIWSARGGFLLLATIWGLNLLIEPGLFIRVLLQMGTMLLLAVFASALGVMFSLWCRTSMRAMAVTLATGLFVGGFYLVCLIPFMMATRNDEIEFLAGCVPFLLTLPMLHYQNVGWGHESNIVGVYVFGIIGYTVASVSLIAVGIGNFDWFTDRTARKGVEQYFR